MHMLQAQDKKTTARLYRDLQQMKGSSMQLKQKREREGNLLLKKTGNISVRYNGNHQTQQYGESSVGKPQLDISSLHPKRNTTPIHPYDGDSMDVLKSFPHIPVLSNISPFLEDSL
ncbi:hypothetical protein GOODEAATRI_029433 [Goodea atripinnis]|uniref:Uncharacterized protein n=1 Tax=Goodea atripinnis TaxID=208336 RepID=A0ABV0NEM9_9TELE